MNEPCAQIMGRFPDWNRGTLNPEEVALLEEHLAGCEACSAEAEFVRMLDRTRPEPPPGLLTEIEQALDAELASRPVGRLRRRAAPWTWSAAAALVMALGTALVWQQIRVEPMVIAEGLEPVPESWLTTDAVVAGALVLDDLSDEDLSALLEEVGG